MFTLSIQNFIQTKIEGNLIKLNFCLLDFFFKVHVNQILAIFHPEKVVMPLSLLTILQGVLVGLFISTEAVSPWFM